MDKTEKRQFRAAVVEAGGKLSVAVFLIEDAREARDRMRACGDPMPEIAREILDHLDEIARAIDIRERPPVECAICDQPFTARRPACAAGYMWADAPDATMAMLSTVCRACVAFRTLDELAQDITQAAGRYLDIGDSATLLSSAPVSEAH